MNRLPRSISIRLLRYDKMQTYTPLKDLPHFRFVFTDNISGQGAAIGRVRPPVLVCFHFDF